MALRARAFSATSRLSGTMGFRVMILTFGFLPQTQTGKSLGQVQPCAAFWKAVLTMRSSSEWKVMTASRHPGFSTSIALSIASATAPSSSLTAMRMA